MGLGKFLRKLPVAYRQRRSCFSAAGSPLTFKVLGILPEILEDLQAAPTAPKED